MTMNDLRYGLIKVCPVARNPLEYSIVIDSHKQPSAICIREGSNNLLQLCFNSIVPCALILNSIAFFDTLQLRQIIKLYCRKLSWISFAIM